MSWDAYLVDDRGHTDGEWNYTHNTSPMIYAVLTDLGQVPAFDGDRTCLRPDGEGGWVEEPLRLSWWGVLDGMSGPGGGAYLHSIIIGLEADPERFLEMNPENGWGDYDSLVETLKDMRDAVPEWPCTWKASG